MIVKVVIEGKTIKKIIFHPSLPNCILQVQLLSFKENLIGKRAKPPSVQVLIFPQYIAGNSLSLLHSIHHNLCPIAICMPMMAYMREVAYSTLSVDTQAVTPVQLCHTCVCTSHRPAGPWVSSVHA